MNKILLVLIASSSAIWGAIATDNKASGFANPAATSVTFSMTVGSGTNRYLSVGVGYYSATNMVSSITYSGVPLTLLERDNDGTHANTNEYWYLLSPPSGTANIVVTMNASTKFGAVARSYTGVNQTSTIGAHSITYVSGAGTSISGNLTTQQANSMVEDVLITGGNPTAGGSQTNDFSLQVDINGVFIGASHRAVATASAITNSWTWPSTGGGKGLLMVELIADTVSPAPTLTSVTPNAGGLGAAVNVTLVGTGFIAGATVAVSGTLVTVGTVTVVNTTTITTTFTIASNAATTARNVTVTTSNGTSGAQTFTVQSVLISSTAIPTAIVNTAYNWTMTATGGATPYTWSIGTKPAWMSISSAGVLSGTPTAAAAAANVQITVTDNNSATNTVTFSMLTEYAIGIGCTTAHQIDHDCDNYGVGTPVGADADDDDASVNTVATWAAKYGSGNLYNAFTSFFGSGKRNYTSLRYIFIDVVNGNDSACSLGQAPDPSVTNFNHPCKTWATAYALSTSGDAFIWRGGTYNMTSPIFPFHGGTPTAQMVFMGFPGERVIINHPTTVGQDGLNLAGFNSTPYSIVVDSLVLQNTICGPSATNPCAFGIEANQFFDPDGWIFRNLDISNYQRGIMVNQGLTNFLTENCYIHDNYTNSGGEGHDIYYGADPILNKEMVATIRNNIFGASNWTNMHASGRCNGCLVDGNIMYSANTSPLTGPGSGNMGLQQSWHNSTFQNNLIFISNAFAFSLNTYTDGAPNPTNIAQGINNNVFRNNTFYSDGRSIAGQTTSAPTVLQVSNTSQIVPMDNGHNTYANNILYLGSTTQNNPPISYCKSNLTSTTSTANTNGTTVTKTGNDNHGFTPAMVGNPIVINGVTYTVQSFTNGWNITVTPSAGTQSGVSWTYTGGDADWWTTDTWYNNVVYFSGAAPGTISVGFITQNLGYCEPTNSAHMTVHDSTWFNANMGTASGNLFTDPLLAVASPSLAPNPGTEWMILQATSTAINAGRTASQAAADIRNITRSSPDSIGAYAGSLPTVTLSPTTLPSGEVTLAYPSTTFIGGGGTAPYTFAVTAGTLPTGLSLSSGVLSGTPTVANTFSFTITATDAAAKTGSVAFSVTIVAAPSITTSSPLPGGTVGAAYSQTIAVSGGVQPFTFAVTSGAVPAGTSLNASTGVISGTPTTATSYSPTIRVTDANGITNSKAFSVTISAAAGAPTISTVSIAAIYQYVTYSQPILASGGTLPYTWSISAGALPTGLTISSSTGVISGAATVAGSYSFTVRCVDNASSATTQAYSGTTSSGAGVSRSVL